MVVANQGGEPKTSNDVKVSKEPDNYRAKAIHTEGDLVVRGEIKQKDLLLQ